MSIDPRTDRLNHKTAWLNFCGGLLGIVGIVTAGVFTYINNQPKSPNTSTSPSDEMKPAAISNAETSPTSQVPIAISEKVATVLSNQKTAEAYHGHGIELAKKDKKSAIDAYTKAIELKHDYTESYYRRGILYQELGDYQSAISDYTQVIKLDPNFHLGYYCRGIAKQKLGDHQGAIDDFTQTIKLRSNFDFAYIKRGFSRHSLMDSMGAMSDYTQFIKLSPDDADGYLLRSIALNTLGDKKGAIEDLNQIDKLKDNVSSIYMKRATAWESFGENKRAIEDLNQAAELFRKEGNIERYQEALDRTKKLST